MQLSEPSINAGEKSWDEKRDESSSLKEDLDEQANGEPHKDDEQVEPEVAATPSIWSRFQKTLLILVALWLALAILRSSGKQRPKVVHANRYSDEYKFRPAASPVVTETLKDGRIRVRGAEPSVRPVPSETPKSRSRKRKSGKRRRAKDSK